MAFKVIAVATPEDHLMRATALMAMCGSVPQSPRTSR